MQVAMQGASAAEPDDEGQHYLDRQRHAAAVQLHSRQLAVALLRGQTKMPRGCTLNVKPPVKAQINADPAAASVRGAQHLLIHNKQQPGSADKPKVIVVSVSSTAAGLQLDSQQPSAQQQQGQPAASSKHAAFKPRALVHRQPDFQAAQQFMQEIPTDELAGEGVAPGGAGAAAAVSGLAPRITADPAHVGQQLAGWTRVAAPGEAGEGDFGEADGLQDEEMGAGMEDEGYMMDEEEWV